MVGLQQLEVCSLLSYTSPYVATLPTCGASTLALIAPYQFGMVGRIFLKKILIKSKDVHKGISVVCLKYLFKV